MDRSQKIPEYRGRGQFPLEIDELVFLPIKSAATRVAALLSGEADFVQDLPIQDVARLRGDKRPRVNLRPENRVIFGGCRAAAVLQRQGPQPTGQPQGAQGPATGH